MNASRVRVPSQQDEEKLGFLGTFSVGIGGIVGGGIFATLGLAGSEARRATELCFLVAGIAALPTAYSYIRLSLTYPGKGGTVTAEPFDSRSIWDAASAMETRHA